MSSLFRDSTVAKTVLRKGSQIARGAYEPKSTFSISIDGISPQFEPIILNYDNKRSLGNTNINLLIGKNGSGKSHVLRHLIDLLSGVKENHQAWPYFHKVIVASYSPFESFLTTSELFKLLPQPEIEKEEINTSEATNPRPLVNDYSYIGFKNQDNEFSLEWPRENSAMSIKKIIEYDLENSWWNEKKRFKLLFSTLQQAIDFDTLVFNLENGNQLEIIEDNFSLIKDANNISFKDGISFYSNGEKAKLSSGQTIYSYLLPCLVSEIEDESLIILDEPELYFHPSMEISLFKMLKTLLDATKSNAVIATHSSILTREVEQKGITILRKQGKKTYASHPSIETFGQSIETIISEAFEDSFIIKPYQESVSKKSEEYKDIPTALESISNKIGDAAFSYLAGKIQDDSDITIKIV